MQNKHLEETDGFLKNWSGVPESTVRRVAAKVAPGKVWTNLKKATVVGEFVRGEEGQAGRTEFVRLMDQTAAAYRRAKTQLDKDIGKILSPERFTGNFRKRGVRLLHKNPKL